MAGYVWEWCLNKIHNSMETAPDVSNDSRVLCGESRGDYQILACSVHSNNYGPYGRFDDNGIRVCCVSPIK